MTKPTLVVIDDVEVIRLLSEKESTAALVLISGFDSGVLHSAQELALEHNMNFLGTLQKPFKSNDLKNILSTHRPLLSTSN